MFDFLKRKSVAPTLGYETDVHSHVIPGLDDGSPDMEHSLFLIHAMKRWGIKRILATPHVTEETFENTPATITPAFNALKDALKEQRINIDIDFSSEYRVDEYFDKMLKEGTIKLLPNNHILLENSFLQEPWQLSDMIFNLQLKSYNIILAHPERYKYYIHKRTRYQELHDAGAMFQVNVLSLAGHYGKDVKENAIWLVENGLVDFLGTDLHNVNHVNSIDRLLNTSDYKKILKKINLKNDTAFI